MILLTGASGFIGKHLLNALINKFGSDKIIAFTSSPIKDCIYLLHNNYTFSDNYFVKAGDSEVIDTIIHAGAFTPKSGAEANNWQLCNQNIINTQKLISAKLPGLKKFIYLSTLDVYAQSDIISEHTPTLPISLYGYSKLYGEKMVEAWSKTESKICQILRVGHVYGPGEEAYLKIIPSAIKKIITDQPVEIWGTGNELRAFIYINDLVKAIINAIDFDEFIEPVNLASTNSISIKDLVDKIIQISNKQVVLKMMPTSALPRSLTFDNSKMKKYLLSSESSLEEGLKAEWAYMQSLLS